MPGWCAATPGWDTATSSWGVTSLAVLRPGFTAVTLAGLLPDAWPLLQRAAFCVCDSSSFSLAQRGIGRAVIGRAVTGRVVTGRVVTDRAVTDRSVTGGSVLRATPT